jgi:hypothetical protein
MTDHVTAQEFLKSCHTRELLGMRNSAYSHAYDDMVSGNDGTDDTPRSWLLTRDIVVTYDELYAELATREHIPNKAEAKLIRQQRAKEKKHR